MTVAALLTELRARDVHVWADDDQLQVNALAGVLTPELREQLQQRKGEILEYLRGPAELSFPQQRLWFLDQVEPGGAAYVIPQALEICGSLDVPVLERALGALVSRHDSLRTVFVSVEGRPLQVVSEPGRWMLPVVDLVGEADARQKLPQVLREEASRGFDLERGPLFRARLYRLAADTHVLLLTMHHIVADGWSVDVLIRELGELYHHLLRGEAATLPALRLQYRDFARWQRSWLEGEVLKDLLAHWRARLAGAPQVFELPADRPRPSMESYRGAMYSFTLPLELVDRLRELARREGVTLYMTLLSGFALLLSRYTGQKDILIGTPVANRSRTEIEDLVGCFVNTLVLRANLSGDLSSNQLLARMREECLDAFAHQEVPLERLVEVMHPERDLSRNPLFQVMFALRNEPPYRLELAGLTLRPIEVDRRAAQVDLTLDMQETPEGLRGSFEYATDLFDEPTIARMATHLRLLLEGMAVSPGRRVWDLPMLTAAERQQLVGEWNDTAVALPAKRCMHELVAEQVARTPDAIALVSSSLKLSYRELDRRANQLAHVLRKRGVGPDILVGLCVNRTPGMIIALLGILKAGGAYVPLDPDYPAERLAFMLEDCGARKLVTEESLRASLPPLPVGCDVIYLDRDASDLAAERDDEPRSDVGLSHLAYAIYTSGSTGRPKAALVTHRGLLNLALSEKHLFGIGPQSRVLQFASLSFDTSISEIAMALCSGATLYVEPRETILPGPDLERCLEREKITVLSLTPSALAVIDPAAASSVQQVIVGGEPCPAELAARWMGRCRFFNTYGPTETTVTTTYIEYRNGVLPPLIGRPLPNVRVYLLDRMLQPVPEGVAGELYIGGVGVARGYVNRPQLTAERFVPDPFCGTPAALMYRSGDFARWRAGGQIEFIGRLDNQVKLRGFRIELGEVEASLSQHPAVKECVVVVREDAPGDRRLVAYVTLTSAAPAGELRSFLKQRLPDYMVPSAFVTLDKLPLTLSAKVDRKALPVPEGTSYAARGYEAPVGEIETKLAQIWAEILKLKRVGRHDNFFELGGHSLLAMSVIERMRRAGLHTDVRALFVAPTLTALAAVVGGDSRVVEVPPNRIPPGCAAITPDMVPLVQLTSDHIRRIVGAVLGGADNVQDIYPLAPLQEGILFHHLMATEGDPYLLSALLGFDSRARLEAYLQALQAVINRHDILRTAVLWEGLPEPVQVVWRQAKLVIEEISLDPAAGDVAQQLSARFNPRLHRLDVRQAPLTRVYIAHDAPNKRWLLLELNHHLSGDHITLEVVQEEIQSHLLGQAAHLPAPLPFRNFVAQARLGVRQEDHEAFFRKMLGDVDEPTVPFGLTNVHGDGSGISEARCVVAPPLAKRLRERARALGVSAASVYHLAWAQVLARVSGRDDVIFGTVLSGRMQGGDGSDRVLGLFINTLPVRIRIGKDSVQDSVRQTHALLAQLLRHEHAALALAQRCSAVAAPVPLFSALLNYRHSPEAAAAPAKSPVALAGIESLGGEERTNYPLVLSVDDLGDGFALAAQVQSPIDPQRICTFMHTALDQLVSTLESAPVTSLRSLDVLPDFERRQLLVEWNDTKTDYPAKASILELFEAQVRRTPERIAIRAGATARTYAELDAHATRIAHALRSRDVRRGQRIGLCVERTCDMPASVLGILKAGAAYVPLDPTFPRERLRFMADDAECAMLLSTTALARSFDLPRERQLLLDADAAIIDSAPSSPLPVDTRAARPEDPAYLIYTSGSTGKPKGVVVPHRAVVNFLCSMAREPGLAADDVLVAVTTLSFDIAVLEIQLPLTVGATVVLAAPEEAIDGYALRALLEQHRATVMQATPATWRLLLQAGWTSERPFKGLVGGEALPRDLADQLIAHRVQLWNMYGPTETTVWSTCARIAHTSTGITIGRPIANTVVRILDRHKALCPIGVPGELCIGGEGVALGYWNRPELTAEKFVADPFSCGPRATLYRTGDLACYLPDGTLKYLGRLDHQVKIRGFRIELGEIETSISRHPAVREVVVHAREDAPGDTRLVAYLVAQDAPADLVEQLRAMLRSSLPEYMMPAYFMQLAALPLTVNGKVNRKALPAPDTRNAPRRAGSVAPRTPTEERVMAAFREVLARADFGVFDSFFDLGGHSLMATRLMSGLWAASGTNLPLRNLFERPTVAELAVAIDALSWSAKPVVSRAENREHIDL